MPIIGINDFSGSDKLKYQRRHLIELFEAFKGINGILLVTVKQNHWYQEMETQKLDSFAVVFYWYHWNQCCQCFQILLPTVPLKPTLPLVPNVTLLVRIVPIISILETVPNGCY